MRRKGVRNSFFLHATICMPWPFIVVLWHVEDPTMGAYIATTGVATYDPRVKVAASFSFGGRWGQAPRCPACPAESDGHGCGSFLAPFNPKIRLDEIW